eukprot:scaffold23891_cov18-Prasinocladus_malaysianus.AAC.2
MVKSSDKGNMDRNRNKRQVLSLHEDGGKKIDLVTNCCWAGDTNGQSKLSLTECLVLGIRLISSPEKLKSYIASFSYPIEC